MKKNSILCNSIPSTTIGLDLSDRRFQFCQLNAAGDMVDEGQRQLDRHTLRQFLAGKAAGARVALETGGHSAWVREAIEQRGHEAVVANAAIGPIITTRGNWLGWRAWIRRC